MANQEQLEILHQGVEVWNKWREKNPYTEIDLYNANLMGTDLGGVNLSKADLRFATLANTNFSGAKLDEANMVAADLQNTNLSKANLYKADLGRCLGNVNDFSESNLSEANLLQSYFPHAYFWKANFYKAYINQTDLSEADLRETQLKNVQFFRANLNKANLTGADLSEASVFATNLREANLSEANFSRTYLTQTDLTGANLGKSKFSMTLSDHTTFGFNDLSDIVGLDEVKHIGPSTIGIDTIYKSKGKIPEIFLRGCGLSDMQIEIAKLATPSLDPEQVTDITYKIHQLYLGGGIQYYSCFISYNSEDEEFAKHLHDNLQNNGVRCWFAPEDMKIGDQIRPTIDRQIRLRDKLLVILSENSIKSEWVGDEVEGAMEEESKGNRLVLFPVRLDDTVLNTREDWAAKIKRRRHIGDFSNWKDKASYQKAFERLLRDLKATGGQVNGE